MSGEHEPQVMQDISKYAWNKWNFKPSTVIFNSLWVFETLCQSQSEDYVLPGSILWTGVAMLMSCRCSRVSVWKRRSVEPELKAIHMPPPATTMCDTTMPSSWWASNCLWRRGRWHEFLVIYCKFTGTETEGKTWRSGVDSSRDAITNFS